MCSRSDAEHLQAEPGHDQPYARLGRAFGQAAVEARRLERAPIQPEQRPARAPERDPLWPNGGRPLCRQCNERYVYMAGLCSRCWAAEPRP